MEANSIWMKGKGGPTLSYSTTLPYKLANKYGNIKGNGRYTAVHNMKSGSQSILHLIKALCDNSCWKEFEAPHI